MRQGWTLALTREQPLEDLYLLAAYASLESEALRGNTAAARSPPQAPAPSPRTTSSTVEYRLRR